MHITTVKANQDYCTAIRSLGIDWKIPANKAIISDKDKLLPRLIHMPVSLSSISRDIDIVCFSLSRWDAPISSPSASLAKELAKNNRVFYIEHPYSFKDFIKERKAAREYTDQNVRVITPPLVYPINFLPEGKIYNRLSAVNNSILVKTLRKLIARNHIREYIFINFFDPFFLRTYSKRYTAGTFYLSVHG